MLTVEFIPGQNLYLVIPVFNGAETPDHEFVFDSFTSAKHFIDHYFLDPCIAVIDYELEQVRA